jgi:hypothetical protein
MRVWLNQAVQVTRVSGKRRPVHTPVHTSSSCLVRQRSVSWSCSLQACTVKRTGGAIGPRVAMSLSPRRSQLAYARWDRTRDLGRDSSVRRWSPFVAGGPKFRSTRSERDSRVGVRRCWSV